jgi:hypothetical protein
VKHFSVTEIAPAKIKSNKIEILICHRTEILLDEGTTTWLQFCTYVLVPCFQIVTGLAVFLTTVLPFKNFKES